MCRSLMELKKKRLIHKNLKIENIFKDKNKKYKLANIYPSVDQTENQTLKVNVGPNYKQ